jgi:hypothetical protein
MQRIRRTWLDDISAWRDDISDWLELQSTGNFAVRHQPRNEGGERQKRGGLRQ